jgi:cytochrome c biogenesis protein CcmG/thiol:disulfide interchange protein DsbE
VSRPPQPLFTSHARRRPAWRRPGALAALALIAAFLGLLAYGLSSSAPRDEIDRELAESRSAAAPGFELPLLERGSLGALGPRLEGALSDGRLEARELRGLPFALNFWASWCPPCRTEAPRLERTWRSVRERSVLMLGLNMQDVRSDARGFISEVGLTYPNVRDATDAVAREWGVVALPETFFVDRRGKVVGHVIGEISASQLRDGISAARAGRPGEARSGGDRRPTR